MVENITQKDIYSRGKITQPRVSEEGKERIQEIRGERFKEQEKRRQGRKAEPIKKKNLEKFDKTIQKYKKDIKKLQKDITEDYEKDRERLKYYRDRGRYDDERYVEEIKELKEERDINEAELKGTKKAINELQKAKEKYKEFEYGQVLANERYANEVSSYADDVIDAEVSEEEYDIKRRKAEREYKEKFKERTGIGYEQYEKLLSPGAKLDVLTKAKMREKNISRPEALKELEKEGVIDLKKGQGQLTSGEQEKVRAWMEKNKMSPTPEKIKEIIRQPKVTPNKRVAYKNILTGNITYKSVSPEQRSPLERPIYVDPQGKELPAEEQATLILERPELFKEPKLEEPSAFQKFSGGVSDYVGDIKQKGLFTATGERIQDLRQDAMKSLTSWEKGKIEESLKEVKKEYEKSMKEGNFIKSGDLQRDINLLEGELKNYERYEKTGTASPRAQINTFAAELITDFAIPIVGVVDFGIMGGWGIETIAKEKYKRDYKPFIDALKPNNLTEKDVEDISKSIRSPLPFQISEAVSKKINSNIKKKGIIDGLEESAKQGYEPAKKMFENVANFFTKADVLDKLKENKKELKDKEQELIREQKKDKVYDEGSFRNAINELRDAQNQVEDAIKNTKEQKIVTWVTTGMLALTGVIAGGRALTRARVRNIRIANYDDAIRRYNQLKKLSKQDVSLRYTQGVQQIDTYAGDWKRIKNLGIIDYIEDIKDVKKIDIAKSSQAFVQRKPILKKIEFPKSLKKLGRGKNPYLVYLPEVSEDILRSRTIAQINSMPGYNVYYKNALTYNIVYKNGTSKAVTLLARSKKPLPNFRNPFNAIKYGSGKKLVRSTKIGDDIVLSQVNRLRAGRTIPEGSILARGNRIIETRTPTRARVRSAEEYWGLSAPRSKTAVKKVAETSGKTGRVSAESFFFGTRRSRVRTTRTISDPITIDLGRAKQSLRDSLATLKRAKRSKTIKLSNPQKALDELETMINKASRQGKRTITIKPKTLNKLSRSDLDKITASVSTIDVGTPRIASLSKTIKTGIKSTSNEVKALSSNLNQISSKLDKTIDKFETKRFVSGLTKTDKRNIEKQIKDIRKEIDVQIKKNTQEISKVKSLVKQIRQKSKTLGEIAAITQVSSQNQKISQLQGNTQRLRLRSRQAQISLNNLRQTPISATTPRPKAREPRMQVPRTRIPSFGFPSDVQRKRKTTTKVGGVPGFQTEIRRKGKWVPFGGIVPKSKAKTKGIEQTGKSLAQSFRLRKTGVKVPKSESKEFNDLGKYYKKKSPKGNIWIEKPKAKIDSPQEKRALKRARSKSKTKKKTKKRRTQDAKSFWFGSR